MPLRFAGRGWLAWGAAVILVILSVGDVLTTMYIIAGGAGREGNPFMAWLMVVLGLRLALGVKVVLTAGIAMCLVGKWEYHLARMGMSIAIGMHCLVVGRHLFYILGGYV